MKTKHLICGLVLVFFFCAAAAPAQLFWRGPRYYVQPAPCASGQCSQPSPTPKVEPDVEEPEEESRSEESEPIPDVKEIELPAVETMAVSRSRFYAESTEIADACDEILDRLENRYGKPKVWEAFPVYFQRYRGDGVAGYTLYHSPKVVKVVCFEPLSSAKGGTLDHELTHAYFFYFLNSNFDLFLNEGLAQNSEYSRRESLRQTVYRRYSNGEFWDLDKLYGRNAYDGALRIYHQGFSVVDFLVARGGSLWLAAFMDELVKTNNINAALLRYYGYRNLDDLQSAWIDYVIYGQNRQTVKAVK